MGNAINLCIRRSDFNTTGMFHLGMSCSHHTRKEEFNLKSSKQREQDGGGVGGCGVHPSPRIHQEHTFRHRSVCRTPAESGQEYLTSRKEYTEPHKTRQKEGTGGKTGALEGLDLPLAGGGTEAWVQFPHQGNCLSRRRNI